MRPNPHSSDLGQPDTTQYSKTQCLPSNSVVTKPRVLRRRSVRTMVRFPPPMISW